MSETNNINQTNTEIEQLSKKLFKMLEQGDFINSNDICTKLLNLNPNNTQALLGKIMTSRKIRIKEELANCVAPLEDNPNYPKLLVSDDKELIAELEGYNSSIKARVESDKKDKLYAAAIYKMSKKNILAQEAALKDLESISDWKDSKEQIEICKKELEKLKEQEENIKLERQKKAELKKIKRKSNAKRNRIIAIAISVIILSSVSLLVSNHFAKSNEKYSTAIELIDNGSYDEAYALLKELGNYKDASELAITLPTHNYNLALDLIEQGNTDEAFNMLSQLKDYEPAKQTLEKFVALKVSEKYSSSNLNGNNYEFQQEYIYDENNNLIKQEFVNSNGFTDTTVYTYDENNRLVKTETSDSDGTIDETEHTYDGNNNIIKTLQLYSAGYFELFEYTYDNDNNLIKEISDSSARPSYTKEYVYENNLLIKELYSQGAYNIERTTEYTYNSNNDVITKTVNSLSIWEEISEKTEYTYDENNNLIKEVHSGSNEDTTTTEYTYDSTII